MSAAKLARIVDQLAERFKSACGEVTEAEQRIADLDAKVAERLAEDPTADVKALQRDRVRLEGEAASARAFARNCETTHSAKVAELEAEQAREVEATKHGAYDSLADRQRKAEKSLREAFKVLRPALVEVHEVNAAAEQLRAQEGRDPMQSPFAQARIAAGKPFWVQIVLDAISTELLPPGLTGRVTITEPMRAPDMSALSGLR
ncbi:MAG TPA: hypothetical protein VGM13_12745 [Thermoanaerobaculia bacterium]